MRSIIILALLMSTAASAQLKSTESQQVNNETQQQMAMLNEKSTSKRPAPDISTVRALTPETKPATQAKTKPSAKTKKTNTYINKSRSQRMNFLTFIMMLKDGKQ